MGEPLEGVATLGEDDEKEVFGVDESLGDTPAAGEDNPRLPCTSKEICIIVSVRSKHLPPIVYSGLHLIFAEQDARNDAFK